jgi:undecaprenyl diphosphate synthase
LTPSEGRRAETVAIITDGNGRWAEQRGLPTVEGHRAGADTVKARLRDAAEFGVRQLTVYSFSTENWSRSPGEVRALMKMFAERIERETPELDAEGVRMRFIGNRSDRRIPSKLRKQMEWAEETTADNDVIDLFVAFNYGSRDEIVRAAELYEGGGEEAFGRLVGDPLLEDPDLLIRTSGEHRISNFLLWQCAYSEMVFHDALWPDFSREDFESCLTAFANRERRFGGRK